MRGLFVLIGDGVNGLTEESVTFVMPLPALTAVVGWVSCPVLVVLHSARVNRSELFRARGREGQERQRQHFAVIVHHSRTHHAKRVAAIHLGAGRTQHLPASTASLDDFAWGTQVAGAGVENSNPQMDRVAAIVGSRTHITNRPAVCRMCRLVQLNVSAALY